MYLVRNAFGIILRDIYKHIYLKCYRPQINDDFLISKYFVSKINSIFST